MYDKEIAKIVSISKEIDQKIRGGKSDDAAISQAKLAHELEELQEELDKPTPDINAILSECADVLYYAIKLDLVHDSLNRAINMCAGIVNTTFDNIVAACIAKYQIRAQGIKDHDAENKAIGEAISQGKRQEMMQINWAYSLATIPSSANPDLVHIYLNDDAMLPYCEIRRYPPINIPDQPTPDRPYFLIEEDRLCPDCVKAWKR